MTRSMTWIQKAGDIGARVLLFRLALALGIVAAAGLPAAAAPDEATPKDAHRTQTSEPRDSEDLEVRARSLEGPVDPATYLLGPGDLLKVRIQTRPPVDVVLRLSPEGYLVLPEGPSVPLAGCTLLQADSVVTRVLAAYYKNPKAEIHLLDLRNFRVYVVGEVEHVGMIQASPADRVSELIERAGGTKENASTRAIRLTRSDGRVLPVDLGMFGITGSLEHDPPAEAGDRIYVPPRSGVITISGAVRKAGEVEAVPGDSVATALALAHGLREDALPESAYVESFEGTSRQSHRVYLNLRNPDDRRFALHERDLLFVRPQPNWTETRTVVVVGEVRYPGMHALPADSLPLTKMIELAGGFTPFASLPQAYVVRRRSELPPDPEFERLSKLASTDMTADEQDYYSLKLRTQEPKVSVDFNALFVRGDLSYDIFVRPGDEINVPRLQPYVTVVGEVARPGNIPFDPTMTVAQYIQRAGDFTFRAAKGKVAVIRALTGEWVRKGKVHQLRPGDTIWVPQKPAVNYWKGVMDTIGFLSQLATVYLVISNAVGK
jgi:polysaccharide export outer membrane protein